ncbi:hypothetical protein GGR63_000624 [Xanthomonas sp. 3272]|nr:hypothetical protein [Xanthomonas arboricola]NJC00737.1 hypothetical protein [Xanthomonas arboricola]
MVLPAACSGLCAGRGCGALGDEAGCCGWDAARAGQMLVSATPVSAIRAVEFGAPLIGVFVSGASQNAVKLITVEPVSEEFLQSHQMLPLLKRKHSRRFLACNVDENCLWSIKVDNKCHEETKGLSMVQP